MNEKISPAGAENRQPSFTALKVDRALSIYGWMFPWEVMWLAHEAASHRRIVELGSYLGRSTRALADNTEGWVFAVDDFKGPRDVELPDHDEIFERFVANMDGVTEKIRVCREDFSTVNPANLDPPFDMIFIDGCHEYESIRRDIDKWLPYLASGGTICGHDFTESYPGVMEAVLETFTHKVQTVPLTSIWSVTP